MEPTVDTGAAELGSTTITLSWTVPDGPVVTNSLVMWELASSGGSSARAVRDDGSGSSELLDGNIRSYTIEDLRSSTSYNITVILINPAGNSSMQVTLSTEGKYTMCSVHKYYQPAQVCYCSALTEGPSSGLVHVSLLSFSLPLPLSPSPTCPLSLSPSPPLPLSPSFPLSLSQRPQSPARVVSRTMQQLSLGEL